MKRRTFLTGSATAAAGLSVQPAFSQSAGGERQPLSVTGLENSAAQLRAMFWQDFEDLLGTVWKNKIDFVKLKVADAEVLPIDDNHS